MYKEPPVWIFATLSATCDISDFQFRFSFKITPRKFVSFTLTIFWLSILIWILQIECFYLGLKTINLVFLRFRESLFALNQIDISKFNISERYFRSLCGMNTLVSSANNIRSNRLEALLMSLMYSKKNRGSRIEPWGTPHEISFLNEWRPLYSTYCFLFEK